MNRYPLLQIFPAVTLIGAALLSGCSAMDTRSSSFSQGTLPDSIKVPAGHKVAMETVGTGDITYECRDKVNAPGAVEWTFIGPQAVLKDRSGKQVGRYYGPPATWEATDGSKLTGTQQAVAPSSPGNLPYQLVKANPSTAPGAMAGVAYVQRVALTGGVAPKSPCAADTRGRRDTVAYQADYIFWKAE